VPWSQEHSFGVCETKLHLCCDRRGDKAVQRATQTHSFSLTLAKRKTIVFNFVTFWEEIVICPQFVHSTFPLSADTNLCNCTYVWNVNGIFLVLRKCLFFKRSSAALALQQYWTGQLIRSAETVSAKWKHLLQSQKRLFLWTVSFLSYLSKVLKFPDGVKGISLPIYLKVYSSCCIYKWDEIY
jgi:hypothetical protein